MENKIFDKALGMIEYKNVPTGMFVCDFITKTAEIDIIEAYTVCPGKYLMIFSGELSAVKIAIDLVNTNYKNGLIDQFVIGNPHGAIFDAIKGEIPKNDMEALGIIETKTAASAILVADTAAKSAIIKLLEIRLAKGMCGKSYVLMAGSVANIEEAVKHSCKLIENDKLLVDYSVIPRPTEKFWKTL